MSRRDRRICVVTATRAEYGLLTWIMRELAERDGIRLQVVVTGTHLVAEFGETWKTIEADGFTIDAKVDMLMAGDSAVAATKSAGMAAIGLADAFARLAPDAVLVLGDRYELLPIATAALCARIPLLHLCGGEVTEGALDDYVRHAVTKLASLHFPATECSRARIIQMGEAPGRVFTVGSPGLENIRRLPLLERAALSHALDFDVERDFVLVTYHPETLAAGAAAGLDALLTELASRRDLAVVLTGTNADPGYAPVQARLAAFAAAHSDRVMLSQSLGQLRYLSAMRHCRAVMGNSSSGIIEAPSMGVPTVNVGDRQRGRERAASVIDAAETRESIAAALDHALTLDARGVVNPYGDGHTAQRVVDIIAAAELGPTGPKPFHELR